MFLKYKCHKVVEAMKITEIRWLPHLMLSGEIGCERVSEGWMARYNPEVGGYLVKYEDGYLSYSPAKAFEEGYTLIKD